MSTASPNPSSLIILAVLGIGAYWFFSKQAKAKTPAATYRAASGGNTANKPTSPNYLQGVVQGLDSWINGQAGATQQAASKLPSYVDGDPTNPSTSYLDYMDYDV